MLKLLQSLIKPPSWIWCSPCNWRILNNLKVIKRGTTRRIPIMRKGFPLPKTPRREALKKSERVIFLVRFVEMTILLINALGRMRSIDYFHNNDPPNNLLF
jgi:hypothetical protein